MVLKINRHQELQKTSKKHVMLPLLSLFQLSSPFWGSPMAAIQRTNSSVSFAKARHPVLRSDDWNQRDDLEEMDKLNLLGFGMVWATTVGAYQQKAMVLSPSSYRCVNVVAQNTASAFTLLVLPSWVVKKNPGQSFCFILLTPWRKNMTADLDCKRLSCQRQMVWPRTRQNAS